MSRPLIRLGRELDPNRICWSCLHRLARKAARPPPSKILKASVTTSAPRARPSALTERTYFSANDCWSSKFNIKDDGNSGTFELEEAQQPQLSPVKASSVPAAAAIQNTPHPLAKDSTLPHRRRKRREQALPAAEPDLDTDNPHALPPDASSTLSSAASLRAPRSLSARALTYLSLSKPRLTFLMVLTTTTAYSLFPVAITPLSTSMSLSPLTLLNLTAGTALASACANALNMLMEPAHDAKMSRTRARPIVRGLISKTGAGVFAVACGISGITLLHLGVNPTVAFLGALNIALYAGVYTPLKRLHVVNTWVGAVVGGIPPLMGWCAAAGQAALNNGVTDAGWRDFLLDPATSAGGWLLAGLLFAWQFPHFNAIAYTVRHEYAAAGYKMLASFNVRKNGLIALRYSLAMVPLCAGLCYVGVTGWGFFVTSGAVNGWMIREAWRFWRRDGGKGSARGLFWASVWHLPLVLVLAMVHKRGMWERFVKGGFEDDEEMLVYAKGEPGGEEEEEEMGEDEDEVVLRDRVA